VGHVVVVGAGIVGLAIGSRLARDGRQVTVLEKEDGPARHQTGRNSGVIHSGLYYAPGSLKARMAAAGQRSMTAFARERGVDVEITGKLVVATTPEQVPQLHKLAERAVANGVRATLVGPAEARDHEPHARCVEALWVETTGIVDYRAVCRVLAGDIEAAGGEIEHFGMPVDPGNLMLIGRLRGQAVIGAPGCARSPKENGFDWVLMRLLAGLPVSRADITGMGVGGLLMEIVTRPQPREEAAPEHGRQVAAVVLAAGRSTRMGAINKLIAEIGGKPLVRIAAEHALASRAKPVIVVTGHEREKVEGALAGLPVRFVHNPDYAEGLGTSLKAGIAAVRPTGTTLNV